MLWIKEKGVKICFIEGGCYIYALSSRINSSLPGKEEGKTVQRSNETSRAYVSGNLECVVVTRERVMGSELRGVS